MTANNVTLDEQIVYLQEQYMTHAEIHGESEPTLEAILATLQSIKDAGDDVVEPVRDEYECYDHYVDALKDYADHLLSAYKRACVERDEAIKREVSKHQQYVALHERHAKLAERAEKAESEREQFRKDAERYRWLRDKEVSIRIGGIASPDDDSSEIEVQCLRQIPEVLDSAIDSARNK